MPIRFNGESKIFSTKNDEANRYSYVGKLTMTPTSHHTYNLIKDDHRPNMKGKTTKHAEENKEHSHDIGKGKDFLNSTKRH